MSLARMTTLSALYIDKPHYKGIEFHMEDCVLFHSLGNFMDI